MKIFDWSEDTLLDRIRAVCFTIMAILLPIIGILILATWIAVAVSPCKCEKNENVTSTLPNIDREEARHYMDSGECMGDEIEEKKFSFWICKE